VDDEVGDLFTRFHDPLVGDAGGKVDDVACGDVDAGAVADAGAADFVGGCLFGVDYFAAVDQRGFAGLHDHDVSGGLVDFGNAAGVVYGDGKAVVAEVVLVRDALRGNAMGPNGHGWSRLGFECRGRE